MVEFKNGIKGFIIDLMEDSVGVVVLGDYLTITAGMSVTGTGFILSLPVSEQLLGRVVDSLGQPQDAGPKLRTTTYYPIERIAAGVIYRY
ncbi:MAG: F0F1 ATP synthase subunit alpha, partial [Patescibacteria group bacterium]